MSAPLAFMVGVFSTVAYLGLILWPVYCSLKRRYTMTPEQLEKWEMEEAMGEHR